MNTRPTKVKVIEDSDFVRTVIMVEVLTKGAYEPDSLEDVARDTIHGDASGDWKVVTQEVVSRKRMAKLLEAQGSDASFLLCDEESEE